MIKRPKPLDRKKQKAWERAAKKAEQEVIARRESRPKKKKNK